MHTNLFWDDLIKRVLQEIGKFGLDTATINQYRQTYTRLKKYASARNVEHYCDDLIQSFLRHSAASRMLSRGVPVTTISSMLGHAHKASTDRYLAIDQERMRECALDLSLIPVNCAGLSS